MTKKSNKDAGGQKRRVRYIDPPKHPKSPYKRLKQAKKEEKPVDKNPYDKKEKPVPYYVSRCRSKECKARDTCYRTRIPETEGCFHINNNKSECRFFWEQGKTPEEMIK